VSLTDCLVRVVADHYGTKDIFGWLLLDSRVVESAKSYNRIFVIVTS
jgi:hypothetical protein